MEYRVNLIFLVVFCSKIVVSFPFAEKNVRHRAYHSSNWPANQHVTQQNENSIYVQPQNVYSGINTYNQFYDKERDFELSNEAVVLPKVVEETQPYKGVVNERQNYNNIFQNKPQYRPAESLAAAGVIANDEPSLNTVAKPYFQPTQYEYQQENKKKCPPNIRENYYQEPLYSPYYSNGRYAEDSQSRQPEDVTNFAIPYTQMSSKPSEISLGLNGYYNHRKTLPATSQRQDIKQILSNPLLQNYLASSDKRYIVIHPNGTMENVEKLESVTHKHPNYKLVNADDVVLHRRKTEVQTDNVRRLQPPHIPDEKVIVSPKSKTFQSSPSDRKTFQYDSQESMPKKEYENRQYSHNYFIPNKSDTKVHSYVSEPSSYVPHSFVTTPTRISRFTAFENSDISNIQIDNPSNELSSPSEYNKNNQLTPSTDKNFENVLYKKITVPSFENPPDEASSSSENNPNNLSLPSKNSVTFNNNNENEILTISPIDTSDNEPKTSLEDDTNNSSIPLEYSDVSNVYNKNEIIAEISTTEPPTNEQSLSNTPLGDDADGPSIQFTSSDIINDAYENELITVSPIKILNNKRILPSEDDTNNDTSNISQQSPIKIPIYEPYSPNIKGVTDITQSNDIPDTFEVDISNSFYENNNIDFLSSLKKNENGEIVIKDEKEHTDDNVVNSINGPTSDTDILIPQGETESIDTLNYFITNDSDNVTPITPIDDDDVSLYRESNLLSEYPDTGNEQEQTVLQGTATTVSVTLCPNSISAEATDTDQSIEMDVANIKIANIPELWFKTDAGIWEKMLPAENTDYDVVYFFEALEKPVVEKSTKTTVYPNGTIVQEFTETSWGCKGDTEPIVLKSTRVIDDEGQIHMV